MNIVICSPESRRPNDFIINECLKINKETGGILEFSSSPMNAVFYADCLYTDVWISMGEEENKETKERIELLKPYQINSEIMDATKNKNTLFLHCLPAIKGMEVTEEIFESRNSAVFDQAENRMHTIKALLIATMQD
jgi:ornithine carbamoyltransferase